MGDIVGRKWGIVSACGIFVLGVGLQMDTKWATFIVGRGELSFDPLHSILTFPIFIVIAGLGVVC